MVLRTLYNGDNNDDVRNFDVDVNDDDTMTITTLYMAVVYQGIYNKY